MHNKWKNISLIFDISKIYYTVWIFLHRKNISLSDRDLPMFNMRTFILFGPLYWSTHWLHLIFFVSAQILNTSMVSWCGFLIIKEKNGLINPIKETDGNILNTVCIGEQDWTRLSMTGDYLWNIKKKTNTNS